MAALVLLVAHSNIGSSVIALCSYPVVQNAKRNGNKRSLIASGHSSKFIQKPTLFIHASHKTNCFTCYGMSSDKIPAIKAYRDHSQQSIMGFSNVIKSCNCKPYSSTLPCNVNLTNDATSLFPHSLNLQLIPLLQRYASELERADKCI